MIGLPESVRILLFTEPTDMRKGFDGLGALVAAAGEDVYQGHLYVFLSRRRDRAKILTFQKGGFVLWYKRLERGRFRPVSTSASGRVAIDATELAMLLDGIDVARVQRARHWKPRNRSVGIDTIARV
jgi:transposase